MPAELTKDTLKLEKVASAPSTSEIGAGNAAFYIKESDDRPYSKDGDSGDETQMFQDLTVRDEQSGIAVSDVDTLVLPRGAVEDMGAGNVRLRVMPSPTQRRVSWIQAMNTGYVNVGLLTQTDAITPVNGNDTDTAYAQHSTTAAANTAGGISSATFNYWQPGYNPFMACRFRLGATITGYRVHFGLCSALPSLTSDTFNPTHYIGLRYSTTGSDSGFKLLCSDASGQTLTDLGAAAPVASAAYDFRMWVIDQIVYAQISADGGVTWTTVVTNSSNVPPATQNLGYVGRHITTTAAIRVIKIARMYFESN